MLGRVRAIAPGGLSRNDMLRTHGLRAVEQRVRNREAQPLSGASRGDLADNPVSIFLSVVELVQTESASGVRSSARESRAKSMASRSRLANAPTMAEGRGLGDGSRRARATREQTTVCKTSGDVGRRQSHTSSSGVMCPSSERCAFSANSSCFARIC